MNDIRLISVDDIREVTSISKNIDADLLEPYIEISQDYFCKDILGTALMTGLMDQITGNSVSDLNRVLLVQYIRPVICYGAWHEYIPFSSVKSMPVGEVKQSSTTSQSASQSEVADKRAALKDKVIYYQKRMREYLEKSKDQYPLYRSTCSIDTGNNWQIYLGKSN